MTDETAPRFRITVLAPLSPRKAYATSGTPPLRAYTADGNSVDNLLKQIAVGVKLEVQDPLGANGTTIRVDLRFSDLRSFRPDAISEQVPGLRALGQVKGVLQDHARKRLDRDASKKELARVLPFPSWSEALAVSAGAKSEAPAASAAPAKGAATPSPTNAKANALDSLLDQVDLGAETPAAPAPAPAPARPSGFSSLISQVARGGAPGVAGSAQVAIERAERAHRALLSSILDHPEFRRLERSWRSVRYLLGEAKNTTDVDVLPLDEDNLVAALGYLAERGGDNPAPDLIVLDIEVPLEKEALSALEVPATLAAQLRAPLVVGARAEALIETDEATQALQAIAKEDWASWVVVATNGALLRGAYTPESARIREPKFAQEAGADGAHVFAPAPYLVAALAARANRHDGWPSAITGPEAGVLGEFEVHGTMSGSETNAFATEKLASVEAAKKHARRGLLAFTSVPNRDTVVCVVAPTLAAGAGQPTLTLSDHLFASRLAAAVIQLGESIPQGTDPRAAEEVAAIALSELFPRQGGSLPVISARVKEDMLEVTVSPRRFAGTSVGELAFEAPLG